MLRIFPVIFSNFLQLYFFISLCLLFSGTKQGEMLPFFSSNFFIQIDVLVCQGPNRGPISLLLGLIVVFQTGRSAAQISKEMFASASIFKC